VFAWREAAEERVPSTYSTVALPGRHGHSTRANDREGTQHVLVKQGSRHKHGAAGDGVFEVQPIPHAHTPNYLTGLDASVGGVGMYKRGGRGAQGSKKCVKPVYRRSRPLEFVGALGLQRFNQGPEILDKGTLAGRPRNSIGR
jgi:hypothetical protein